MMFPGAWGEGVIVLIGEQRTSSLIKSGEAEPFDPMGGKPIRKYLYLNREQIAVDGELLDWLDEASEFSGYLPLKKQRSRKKEIST